MQKPYFHKVQGGPNPLTARIHRQVRFEEVDSMGIVWHGRYPGYFEEARVALGHRYGISYSDFIREQTPVPIRQMQIDYHQPLFFEDEIEIEVLLHWSESARINFEYRIWKSQEVVCRGCTVQLMLNSRMEIMLEPPEFYRDFMDKWKRSELD